MFVRKQPVNGKPSHTRVQVCESFRDGKTTRVRIVKHFGISKSDAELEYTVKIAQAFIGFECERRNGSVLFDGSAEILARSIPHEELHAKSRRGPQRKTEEARIAVRDLREVERVTDGPTDIFAYAFDATGFSSVAEGNDLKTLRQLVSARIAQPASKRKTQENLERYCGFEVSLDHIYRLLSKIGGKEDLVNKAAFEHAQSLFTQGIDILFFDVTTLYFESCTQDDLKDFGYSKDNKFGQVQVTLALATNSEGFPVGYRLFPGNKAETTTLIECVENWRKILPINDAIFIADRGMFSAKNLALLQNAGFKFIVACPLRKQPSSLKKLIFDESNFKPGEIQVDEHRDFCWFGEFKHSLSFKDKYDKKGEKNCETVDGRLVVSFSTSRAKKDRSDRDRMITKTIKKYKFIDNKGKASVKELIANRGYGRFIKVSCKESQEIQLNEEKISEDSAWDGIHAVFTNTNLSPQQVLARYRGLWRIEECFRLSKTNLKIRPVFHFTPKRIRGHIALCFMALVTLKSISTRLRNADLNLSPERIVEEVNSVQSSILEDKSTGKRYKLPSALSELAKGIYRALGVKRSAQVQAL